MMRSQFVQPNATAFPTFNITINDTLQIWGYYGQQGPHVHCTQSTVFSINAVESGPNNFEAFQQIENNPGADNAAEDRAAAGAARRPRPRDSSRSSRSTASSLSGHRPRCDVLPHAPRRVAHQPAQAPVHEYQRQRGPALRRASVRGHKGASWGETPLTHRPYSDPHEPVSRPVRRSVSLLGVL
ncbi:hypothetical protein B0H17DRAFT_1284525 [Mycena rosella]|uniref:Uncharacterized protein n=1 Tax=Mycena rosella TaxID=1033263 RepID=A0AAD7DHR7_MYCRO|nr:hypothetical protein B0H17DRAFT_1284525 [Mycena rosella]